jgi:glycine/D-amino acid oxidase-like deaminating enzyme
VHGGAVARALARRAEEAGAEIVTGHRAVGLTTGGDRVTGVRLDDGRDLDADLTICAAGRHAPALLATAGAALPLVDPAEPGSAAPCLVATTTAARGVVNGLVHAPGLSVRPAPDGGLVLEADDLDAGVDESASPALMRTVGAELLARAHALVPRLRADVAEIRRCVRPLPVDGYPLVGFQRPGLYTAVTHSGITLGPHLALLIEREVHGDPPPELAPYRPDRA